VHGDILAILVLLVLGVAAFFFGVIYAVCRALASLWRGLMRVATPRGVPGAVRLNTQVAGRSRQASGRRTFRVCPREQCRHVERRPARFCSQCGAELPQPD